MKRLTTLLISIIALTQPNANAQSLHAHIVRLSGAIEAVPQKRLAPDRSLGVELRLTQSGDSVFGVYWYTSIGQELPFRGILRGDSLSGVAGQGFAEKFTAQAYPDIHGTGDSTVMYDGTWKSAGKTYRLTLAPESLSLPDSSKILDTLTKLAPGCYAHIPKLVGLGPHSDAIRKYCLQYAKNECGGWDLVETFFSPAFFGHGLLTLDAETQDDADGSQHPSYVSHPLTFDLESGELLTLHNIFDTNTAYFKYLGQRDSQYIATAIAQDGGMCVYYPPESPEDLRWKLSDSTFELGHDDGNICHAWGGMITEVPYCDLVRYLADGSPIWRFLK